MKRIAIWIQGGIGGGNYSQGYPPLFYFVDGLGAQFEIYVYSIFPANKDFQPGRFRFRSANRNIKNPKLRTLLTIFLFLSDHLKNRFSILHAFWVYPAGTISVMLGKLLRIPTIVTIQGGEGAAIKEINYGNMLRPWLKRMTLWTCEKATIFNSISAFLVDQLKQHGLKRDDAIVIPFGPDLSRFQYREKEWDLPIELLHVANLTEVKDQETIIRAVDILRKRLDVILTIVGGDYLQGKLQALVSTLGLQGVVKFVGAIPQADLPAYYKRAHFMLHTSLHEGQSGVIMEAMASGVVVCATRVGIVYDLGDQYFRTLGFRDPDGLAKSVFELWNSREHYNELQQKSYDYVQLHDATWTQDAYAELYHNLNE
jgi:glycosyltransferase involved in cell wall biosynthesis